MGLARNVEISWDELLDAFTGGKGDRVYFLDRHTGEIFFVAAAPDDEDFWRIMESNRERFLEIPRLDYGIERQIMNGFIGAIEDTALKDLLNGTVLGRKPFGHMDEILAFFPEEHERLKEMKDEFLACRVQQWLETNDLFTIDSGSLANQLTSC